MPLDSAILKTLKTLHKAGKPIWSLRLGSKTLGAHIAWLMWHLGLFPNRVKLRFGYNMVFPRGYNAILDYADGVYSPEATVVELVEGFVQYGMTVVDVGAHVGYYTLLFSKLVGSIGKVFSFEPSPEFYDVLLSNLKLNRLRNVIPVKKAVADFCGHSWLYHEPLGGGSSLYLVHSYREPITVDVVTLDAFFSEFGWPNIDLIKLDVEGAELAVLRGARIVMRRNPNLILILELNPSALRAAGVTVSDFFDALYDYGFGRITVIAGNRILSKDASPRKLTSLEWQATVNLCCRR